MKLVAAGVRRRRPEPGTGAVACGPVLRRHGRRRVQLGLRGAEAALERGLLLRQAGALIVVVVGGGGLDIDLDR